VRGNLFKSAGVALLRIAAVIILFLGAAWWVIAQPTWRKQPRATVAADPAQLESHVRTLSESFHPRNFRQVDNLNATADYIAGHFASAGGRVSTQPFSVNGAEYRNVSAQFGPKEGPRWIIGAHYDTHDDTPGADDNASGVAGLLELARLFGENPPDARIELVAYPLEEPPFFGSGQMGSARHAQALNLETDPVRGVVVLEMIGYFSDEHGSQRHPSQLLRLIYPEKGNFITVVGRWEDRRFVKQMKGAMQGATPLPVESIAAPVEVPGIDFSDHRNYWPLDLPAIMITDTAFYRNDHYHTAGDTYDTLDYERMAMAVTAVRAAILTLGH